LDHFVKIYRTQAAAYHALIAAEDVDCNLLPALQAFVPLAGKRVLDLGSGTGRIPLLLRGLGCKIISVDLHHAMLVEQREQLKRQDAKLIQADLRDLPLSDGFADLAVAGWAIGHFTGWYPEVWRGEIQKAVNEMRRTVKPGGALIIFETMGTGSEQAGAPSAALEEYYAILENELGFSKQVVATDYDFGSVERAVELCGFFFGSEMAEKVKRSQWSRVPEWTGIWSKKLNS
jgi:ubiquinone/menaquinone biosynthesis C-methylase UbiE